MVRKKTRRRNVAGEARAAERDAKALELRLAGHKFHEISDKLRYGSAANAHRAVFRRIDEIPREPAEQLVKVMEQQLMSLLRGLWPKAVKGDRHAVLAILSVHKRLSTLKGLDAPKRRHIEANVNGLREFLAQAFDDDGDDEEDDDPPNGDDEPEESETDG